MTDKPEAAPPTNMPWSDDPINSETEDTLDRGRFVTMVAERIDACLLGQESTVFGLVGPWGSGKSSLINLILNELGEDWRVAVFSPWASPDTNGLQYEFLAALASTLEGPGKKLKNAKKAVTKYVQVCTPLLNLVPYAGAAAAGVAAKGIELAAAGKPWHVEFKQVSDTLKALGQKVLIVADDIDRLDPDELLAFLKVVRLLGRFPNVHYLIAYDQATVESLLESKSLASRSAAFMEKIVQYPFEVPPIAAVIQRRLLTDTINELVRVNAISLEPVSIDRASELIAVLAPALVTPRAQTRFREQLISFGGMLSFEEVDVVDYVALSFLRVFYHDVYLSIPSWKSALRSGKQPMGFYETSEISDEDWLKRIRALVGTDEDTSLVKQVLSSLFPGIHSNGILYAREHPKALSDDHYFQRYFILGVAEDDVEDQLIEAALGRILQGDGELEDLQRYIDVLDYIGILDSGNDQRAALAYEKSQKLRSSGSSSPNPRLVRFLFDRMAARPNEEPSIASAKSVLWRWLENEAFSALETGELCVEDLLNGLSSEDVLFLAVRILRPDSSRSDQAKVRALEGLSDHYQRLLLDDLVNVLESGLDFNWIVRVIALGESEGRVQWWKFGKALLNDDDEELLARVILAMVTVNEWKGSEGVTPELFFHADTLHRLFDQEAIRRVAEILPSTQQLSAIDGEDISPENKLRFALANVMEKAQA